MEDLAEGAEVSRRTLFNYFPGKDAAVLGDVPDFDAELVDVFVAGGPQGDLVEDVVVLVGSFLGGESLRREDLARFHDLMAREPRLTRMVRDRFEERANALVQHIEQREGERYDAARARVFVHVMAALFDHSMSVYLEHSGRELGDIYAEAVRHARAVFA